MKKVVLDTNAFSHLIRGSTEVEEILSSADRIYLPVIVVAELLYGFKNGNKEEWNRSILKRFESKATVIRHYLSDETAEIFSDLYLDLKKKGRAIPTHDIWIAACTIETGSEIITYDTHFLLIDQLRTWRLL